MNSVTVQTPDSEHREFFPRIVASINSQGNHRVLIDELSKRGYKILVSKGGDIHHVDLGKAQSTEAGIRIPPELMNECQSRLIEGTRLSVTFAEIGGWSPVNEKEIFGLVVCGPRGQKLKPFHIRNYEDWGSSFEFSFDRGNHAVIVRSTCREVITVERHELTVNFNHELAYLNSELLWTGKLKDVPSNYRFHEAAKAAAEKALCQHCTKHLHFGVDPNEH